MVKASDNSYDWFYDEVGQRVRKFRGDAEVTQETLANWTGLSRSSIANFEAGRQRVPLHHLVMLAEALNVEPGRLLPTGVLAVERRSLTKRVEESVAEESESAQIFVRRAVSKIQVSSARDKQ